jgi:hypothetical protein
MARWRIQVVNCSVAGGWAAPPVVVRPLPYLRWSGSQSCNHRSSEALVGRLDQLPDQRSDLEQASLMLAYGQ